jgi:hypothetical protein
MRIHLDVLGWLYVIAGAFGVLTGCSLGILASGTTIALAELATETPAGRSVVWLLVIFGIGFIVGGLLMMLTGRSVLRRVRRGRLAALLLAIPNLVVVPFGTALGVYTFWTLLNDDARLEFGRPLRARRPE